MTEKQLQRANDIQSEMRQIKEKVNILDRCKPWNKASIILQLAPGNDNSITGINGKIVQELIRAYAKELNDWNNQLVAEFENL